MEHSNQELIAACIHEAGHYIVFTKNGIACSYPVIIKPKATYPQGFVKPEPLQIGDPRIIWDMVATAAGEAAQKRAIMRYDLNCTPRGCENDQRYVRKFKSFSDKSMGFIKSKAKSQVIVHWPEIERLAKKLLNKYGRY